MTEVSRPQPTSTVDPLTNPLSKQTDGALLSYLDAICDTVVTPMRQAVRTFDQQIGDSVAYLDAERNAAGSRTPFDQWQAATMYRAHLRDALDQMDQALEQVAPARSLAQARRALLAAWEDSAASQSESVSRPAPDALFAQEKADSFYVNSRKSVARIRRKLQGKPPEQMIPLGHLARYHAVVRLPNAVLPTFRAVEQDVARVAATVETLGTNAVYAALRAEQRCRHYADFLAPDERRAATPPTLAAPPKVDPATLPESDEDFDALPDAQSVEVVSTRASDAITEARVAAMKLRDALAAQTLDTASIRERARAVTQSAHTDWRSDVARGGTFLLPMRTRTVEPLSALMSSDRDDEWTDWYERASARLRALVSLMDIPDAAHAALTEWIDALRATLVEPVSQLLIETSDAVSAPLPRVEQAFEQSPSAARQAVSDALSDALGATERAKGKVQAFELEERVKESAQSLGQSIGDLPQQVAETVRVNELHPESVASGAPTVDPTVDVLVETPRAHVQRALDAEAENLAEKAAQPIREAVAALVKEMNDVPAVLRFNLETALSSLNSLFQPDDAGEDDEEHDIETGDQPTAPAERLAEARDLSTNGMRRSSTRLALLAEPLSHILPTAAESAVAPVDRVLKRVIDRSRVEEGLRAQAADVQREAMDQMRETGRRIGSGFGHISWWVRKHARLLRVRVRGLLRRGKEAVGVAGSGDIHELGTVEAIAGLDKLLERLPAPYRHLFSLRPIADPDLLKGRTVDLARIRRHESQWRAGLRNTLVLSGSPGSGLTSLTRVAEAEVLADYDVHRIELRARPASADALAARLSRALDLPPEAGASLADLRTAIHHSPAGERPPVVILGGMEHLMLRAIGGVDLARDVLLFLSQTDTRILWIGTVGTSGWQALRSALPQATSLVLTHEVGGLGRNALEDVIMARHDKSGLALHFEPIDAKTSKAERMLLKATKGEIDTQPALRRLYFDELARVSGQNLTLALVYWLRSVQIDADGEIVRIHQPAKLSFAFLDAFDRASAFTLKAFLDHRSLTIRELSQVMGGVPIRSAIEQFERVGNVLLIEPMPTAKKTTPDPDAPRSAFGERTPVFFASADADVRYRLRPVVIHPVADYLRRQNVLRT